MRKLAHGLAEPPASAPVVLRIPPTAVRGRNLWATDWLFHRASGATPVETAGTQPHAREAMRQQILGNVHKLFHRHEAIDHWATLLRRLATQPLPTNRTRPSE